HVGWGRDRARRGRGHPALRFRRRVPGTGRPNRGGSRRGAVPARADRGAPDGRVAALDIGNARVSLYEEGEGRTRPRPPGLPRYGGDAVVFTDDGALWLAVGPPFPESGGIAHPRPVYTRLDGEGALRDTLFTPRRMMERCPTLSAGAYRRGFWEDVREPFVPKVKWGLGRDGSLLIGCPATYELEVIRTDGTVHRIARAWEPLRIADEHR